MSEMWDAVKFFIVIGLLVGMYETYEAFSDERHLKFVLGALASAGVVAALVLVPALRPY